MLRFKIKELIAEREFKDKQLLKIADICEATGIGRTTMSAMINNKKKNVGSDNIDALCKYFGCDISELLEYIED